MHITKVVIEGLKSFKEQTIFEFQPGLNFVVGHDTAGKDNLLFAIQFVLAGHQFQQLTQTNLVKLLYSSTAGVRVKSAYVEITIDNKDRSIREQGDEIRLKRIITSSKDAYTVNGKSTPMEKVMRTLLQSKLSKANPYYIISHKQTQEICKSSTEKCLAMLCEMADSLKDFKSEESMSEKDSSINYDEMKRKKKLEKELETDRAHKQGVLKKIRVMEGRLESIQSSFAQIGLNFRQIASEDALQGMESVWTIVKQLKEEEEFKDLALEYRGLVIEQFDCPTKFMAAADAIAKNRLFQHVVDTDRASTEIKKRMTEKKLPGDANFITSTQSYSPMLFKTSHFSFDNFEMIMGLTKDNRPGMNSVVNGLFDKFILCPTSQLAREVAASSGLTCVTLSGYVVHAEGDVPDGLSSPNLTRFKLIADYKKAMNSENNQIDQLGEQRELLKEIESRIKSNEAEYQQIKTNTFQTEHKTVQGSLKSLEAEINSLREWIESEKEEIELGPSISLQELKGLMKELVMLKVDGKNLLLVRENLMKVNCLNKKFTKIGFAVESLRKQWQKTLQSDVKTPKVFNQRLNTNEINQQLSLLKAEIDDTILLVDRAPFHLDKDDGFSPRSQFIVTTLNPGLLEYADSNIIGLRSDDDTQSSRVFKMSKEEARHYLDPPLEN